MSARQGPRAPVTTPPPGTGTRLSAWAPETGDPGRGEGATLDLAWRETGLGLFPEGLLILHGRSAPLVRLQVTARTLGQLGRDLNAARRQPLGRSAPGGAGGVYTREVPLRGARLWISLHPDEEDVTVRVGRVPPERDRHPDSALWLSRAEAGALVEWLSRAGAALMVSDRLQTRLLRRLSAPARWLSEAVEAGAGSVWISEAQMDPEGGGLDPDELPEIPAETYRWSALPLPALPEAAQTLGYRTRPAGELAPYAALVGPADPRGDANTPPLFLDLPPHQPRPEPAFVPVAPDWPWTAWLVAERFPERPVSTWLLCPPLDWRPGDPAVASFHWRRSEPAQGVWASVASVLEDACHPLTHELHLALPRMLTDPQHEGARQAQANGNLWRLSGHGGGPY